MIFKNAMSFKARIKQIAKERNITTQQVQQNYLIEVFLEKLAKSNYRKNFILKGGYVIGSILGLDQRTTMDLDTTIKGFTLTAEKLADIAKEILLIPTDESFELSFVSVSEIRETDDYLGYRLKLHADFEEIHELISIDVTTGDAITPREIVYSMERLFSEGNIDVLCYPVESIMAEKIETILSRGIASTRPRDLYDVYGLLRLREAEMNWRIGMLALQNTMLKRNSNFKLADSQKIIAIIKNSGVQQQLRKKYQRQYHYARDIGFDDAVDSVIVVLQKMGV